MIDLKPYFDQLSKEDLIQISEKYGIKSDKSEVNLRGIFISLSRKQIYIELFTMGRVIQIDPLSLQEITDEFEISDISYPYLFERVTNPNPRIRVNAIKAMLQNYPDKCEAVIKEVLLLEKSLYVIRNIWNVVESTQNQEYLALLDQILNKYSSIAYNLDPEEIKFLILPDPIFDLDQLINVYNPIDHGIDPTFKEAYMHYDFGGLSGDPNPTQIHWRSLPNLILEEFCWISIYRGHITGLITDFIPNSIKALKKLRYLRINSCLHFDNFEDERVHLNQETVPEVIAELKSLKYLSLHLCMDRVPDFLKNLPKLRYLNLQGMLLAEIPQWVKEKARKYHSRKYIREGVDKNDACVLGLLEILLGEKIQNYRITINQRRLLSDFASENDEDYFFEDPFYYKINEKGNVTEILIGEQTGEHNIRILPEEIMNLKALKALNVHIRTLNVVPQSIQEKFSVRPQYDDYIKNLRPSVEERRRERASINIDKVMPFDPNDKESIRKFVLDGYLQGDKNLQDYAKDVWSILDESNLTEKEKMDLIGKRLREFEDQLRKGL